MARLKQKECTNCGAPVAIPKDATSVRCEYCGNTLHVEWTRVAPPPASTRPHTVYVSPGLPRALMRIIVFAGLLPVAVPIAIAAGPSVAGLVKRYTMTFPVTCGPNEELTIEGITHSGTGKLVTVAPNCKLRIVNSKLSGDVVVNGGINAEVTLEGSTLEGKDAAIQLDLNGKIFASGRSVISGKQDAIVGGMNLRVEAEDSRIESDGVAVSGDLNAEIHATRTEIVGKRTALAFAGNGHFFGKAASVRSEGTAIEAADNLEVVGTGTRLVADVGIRGDTNMNVKLSDDSRLEARTTGISAKYNLKLQLDASALESGDTAVEADSNPEITLSKKARLSGTRLGLRVEDNLKLTIRDGTLTSEGTAVCGRHNARIDARQATVTGGTALRFADTPTVEIDGPDFTGAKLFESGGCGARSAPSAPAPAPARTPAAPRAPAAPKPAAPVTRDPAFDSGAAAIALNSATRTASAQCRSSSGQPVKLLVLPDFAPDGQNRNPRVSGPMAGSPEAACVERIFRGVRVPPFDPATRPSGLMRSVDLR